MFEIKIALEKGIDIDKYLDERLNSEQMEQL